MNELCDKTAVEQRALIDAREISALELLEAHLEQIDSVNPSVNAIITLTPDIAKAAARRVDEALAKNEHAGILAGLPTAHKDLAQTAGIRTTFGSQLFADFVPRENAAIVQRQIDAGAVTVGKTNVPEWGAGSQTFNTVFGATANPYDLNKTCGGSSGGAAVALATRMVPIADGSDMGGSLRNPASFCNVVGFRCSAGLVSNHPVIDGWSTLGVVGPMARTVGDCALMLAAIVGADARSPISQNCDPASFLSPLESDVKGLRIAISPDFGRQIPIEPAVKDVVSTAIPTLLSLGCHVDNACPDFSDADGVFKTLRAWSFASGHGDGIKKHPDKYKDTIIWNVEAGLELSASDIAQAQKARTRIYINTIKFFEDFDYLILPTSQVSPFPLTQEYVKEIDGTEMETYIDWMQASYFVTVTGLPVIAIPCGFTHAGLPVGIQIVGKPNRELDLLKFAYAFEQATQTGRTGPSLIHQS